MKSEGVGLSFQSRCCNAHMKSYGLGGRWSLTLQHQAVLGHLQTSELLTVSFEELVGSKEKDFLRQKKGLAVFVQE